MLQNNDHVIRRDRHCALAALDGADEHVFEYYATRWETASITRWETARMIELNADGEV